MTEINNNTHQIKNNSLHFHNDQNFGAGPIPWKDLTGILNAVALTALFGLAIGYGIVYYSTGVSFSTLAISALAPGLVAFSIILVAIMAASPFL